MFDEKALKETTEEQTPIDSNNLSQLELFEDLNDEEIQPEETPNETTRSKNEPIQTQDKDEQSQINDETITNDKKNAPEQQVAEMEQVMNNGMQFLAGLFKMSTGKDMGLENQKIEIDKETGEVVMRFKMKL